MESILLVKEVIFTLLALLNLIQNAYELWTRRSLDKPTGYSDSSNSAIQSSETSNSEAVITPPNAENQLVRPDDCPEGMHF